MAGAGLPQKDLGPTALLVKLLRKVLLGITQADLSARSGVGEDLISRYETGTIRNPTSRNLGLLLGAAGVLDLEEPLLLAAGDLSALLAPPPPRPAPADDPLRIRELVQQTARRLLQTDSRLLPGEYIAPNWCDLGTTALLVRLLRRILLDCSLGELSRRTGIHRDVLSRYEAGRVRKPDPANLDRLLAEARVLPLKEPLLRVMAGLSAALARPPRPASADPAALLAPAEVDSLVAFAADLMRRTSIHLGLESDELPAQAPEDRLDLL